MSRTNLFELLGRPVAIASPDLGTLLTDSPETYDDAGLLPSVTDCGTLLTATPGETYDDAALPSLAGLGTPFTRQDGETYDDESMLPLM